MFWFRQIRFRVLVISVAICAAGAACKRAEAQVQSERALTTVAGQGPHAATGPYENLPGPNVPLGGLQASVIDHDGRYLYFSDGSNNVVRRLDLITNRVITVAGISGSTGHGGDGGPATSATLNYPRGLVLDSVGQLYIADYQNHCVRRVNLGTGNINTVAGSCGTAGSSNGAGGLLNLPVSLAVNEGDKLFIGEEGNADVRVWSPDTNALSSYIDSSTTGYVSGLLPTGLAFGPDGLYLSDYAHSKVMVYSNGVLMTYAGNGIKQLAGDGGNRLSASLTYPEGLVYDGATGTLTIVDMGNVAIRQVAVTSAANFAVGTIRTIAGGPLETFTGFALKVPATHGVYRQGGLPFPVYGVSLVGQDYYFVGGVAPSVFQSSDGTGSVVRMSREDGFVIPRFVAGGGDGWISFELPPNYTWSGITFGNTAQNVTNLPDCDLGSSYTNPMTCHASLRLDPFGGPQNNYVRIATTGPRGDTYNTDFGIVAEAAKNSAFVVPQDSVATDLTTLTAPNGAQVVQPAGVAVGLDGRVLVADAGANQVYAVSGGMRTLLAGLASGAPGFAGDGGDPTLAQLNAPRAVLQSPSNVIYIADTGNHSVRAIAVAHNQISTVVGNGTNDPGQDNVQGWLTTMDQPVALAMRRDGTLLIADLGRNAVRSYDPRTGYVTLVAGTGEQSHSGDGGLAIFATLNGPDGIAVGPNDEVYISEKYGNDIRVIDPATNVISTFAGSSLGNAGNSGDFYAPLTALFYAPGALFTEPSGALAVADMGNQRVRYITHPTSSGTQTPRVLPYLAAPTASLTSIARGAVLNGKQLLTPTGAGSLLFTSAATKMLTVVDNGAETPDFGMLYNSSSLTSGSPNFSLSSSTVINTQAPPDANATANGAPYCTLLSNGLLTGETCKWAVVFMPAPSSSLSGAGTIGMATSNSILLPFSLNYTPVPPLVFTPATLDDATINVKYSAKAGSITGGLTPYQAPIVLSGTVPAGLSLSLSGSDVMITGTPTESGTFSPSILIQDAAGKSTSQTVTLKVSDTVLIQIIETIHVSDLVNVSPALQIPVNEKIIVTDAVQPTLALQIPVMEKIKVTDSATVSPSLQVSLTESIHVTDVPTAQTPQAPQTITAPTFGIHVYGDAAFNVGATSSSGLPVMVKISGPAVFVGGTMLKITGAGVVSLAYTQAGNSTYAAAAEVDRQFAVAPAPATLVADDKTRRSLSFNPALTYHIAGLVNGDTAAVVSGAPTLSSSATFASPAGTYPIVLLLGTSASPNYALSGQNGTLTVTGGVPQTITFLPIPNVPLGVHQLGLTAKTTANALKITYTVDSGSAYVSGNRLVLTGTGKVTITASQAGNDTYFPAASVTRSFQVTP